jgi:hypothetical protein
MPRLLCRFGIHQWSYLRNEEGQRYGTCRRCHRDDDFDSMVDPGLLPPCPAGGGGM